MSITLLYICTLLLVNVISLLRQYYGSLVLGFTTPTPKEGTKLIPLPEANTQCQKKKKKAIKAILVVGKDADTLPLIHTHTNIFFGGWEVLKEFLSLQEVKHAKLMQFWSETLLLQLVW